MINSLPFFLWVKSGNISRKFLTFILKIFDKNFERLQRGHVNNAVNVCKKAEGFFEEGGNINAEFYGKGGNSEPEN